MLSLFPGSQALCGGLRLHFEVLRYVPSKQSLALLYGMSTVEVHKLRAVVHSRVFTEDLLSRYMDLVLSSALK